MPYIPHYLTTGFFDNIFTPPRGYVSYLWSSQDNYQKDYYFYWYSSVIGRYVRSYYTLQGPFGYEDNNGRTWTIDVNQAYCGYPILRGRIGSSTYYMYINTVNIDKSYYKEGIYIYPQIGYPCGAIKRWQLDENDNQVFTTYYESYYYTSYTNYQKTLTFTGYGGFQGQTLTMNFKVLEAMWWNSSSTTSKPWGEYVPYSGTYGTTYASGNHYLGNKYWTGSSKVMNVSTYTLSPKFSKRSAYSNDQRVYQITNVHWEYDKTNKLHRWIIWANEAHTRWYECNQPYPIQSQDYTYVYKSNDGSTGSNLTLKFSGYTGAMGWTQQQYYFQPARTY